MGKSIILKVSLVFINLLLNKALAQSNQFYYHKTPGPVDEGAPVRISQLIFTTQQIQSGILFFRDKGEVSYQETEMLFEGGEWYGTIPGNRVTLIGIEYITILTTVDGGRIALPLIDDPFSNPIEIKVTNLKNNNEQKPSEDLKADFSNKDILILSPENRSVTRPSEVVISVSLFNAPNIDRSDFQIFLDDRDYTSQAIISGDVLSLVPDEKVEFGSHSIRINFQTTYGMPIDPLVWTFSVSKGAELIYEDFKYNGSFIRKESATSASSVDINESEFSGKIHTELSWIKTRYNFRKSSRHSKFSQPVDRSSLFLQVTDYLKINDGDIYPVISPYILSGKKVIGRNVNIEIPIGFGFDGLNLFGRSFFAFDFQGSVDIKTVSGLLSRSVQYQRGVDRAYELLTNDTKIDDLGNKVYLLDRKGYTFPRKINSSRLTFNFNNRLSAGFHFMKAKDDYEKIKIFAAENSLFTVDSSIFGDSLSSQFTLTQFVNALANIDTIQIKEKNWSDGNPQENLALGFDLETSLDNRKIILQLGWNMSFTNYNIWAGAASKDSLDLLMDTITDGKLMGNYEVSQLGDFIDAYKSIFTINPLYMSPILPIDPILAEENSLRAILNMPASAYFLRLKGSYSFNNLSVEYRQLGPEYRSFGNPYLTNNIREFSINDRLSLLGRRLMFVIGYKYRDNKLSDLVAHPVATKTISLNTTLVPGTGAPSIILNVQSIGRTNGIDSIDTDRYGNYLGDNRENSNALNIMASVNIPGNFDHFSSTTSININTITYNDNLKAERKQDYFFQKSETQSLSATISTRFNIPLNMTTAFNQTKISVPFIDENNIANKQVNTWTSTTFSAQYRLSNNKLRIRGGLDYTTNGVEDSSSIELYGGRLGCDWDIFKNLALNFNSSLRYSYASNIWTQNSSGFNLSLGYRF